ncbi:unnamed protein product, partial [Brassica rapa subsp. trilocularis]
CCVVVLRFEFRVIECCNVLYRKIMKKNQKVIPNESRRQSLRVRKPDSAAKKPEPRVQKSKKSSKKSKKSRPVREPARAPSVESLSVSDESEREGSDREGSEREVYILLQGLEERILEFMGEGFAGLHVTVETMLESQSSRMSVLEKNQRLLRRRAKKIEDMLTSIESKVEPSHGEDMDFRQWDNDTYEEKDKACSEKEKANAEHEAGKEKDNIENTEEEGEKEADDNAQQEGEKEKENSEADEEEDSESESEELKQMKERSRRQAAKLWKEIANEEKIGGKHDEEESEEKEAETSEEENENNDEKDEEKVVESEAEGEDDQVEPRVETNRTGETPTPPRGSQSAGTPTPPRGRTKAMAARRPIIRRMEDEPGKGEKVVEEEKQKKEAVETEEKSREKVAVEEKKKEEVVKEHAEEVVEEYSEEEKQRWIMVVYKKAPSPWIMYRCKENVVVAAPKKSGRPKRKSQWVQTPFTEGKKRKTKP